MTYDVFDNLKDLLEQELTDYNGNSGFEFVDLKAIEIDSIMGSKKFTMRINGGRQELENRMYQVTQLEIIISLFDYTTYTQEARAFFDFQRKVNAIIDNNSSVIKAVGQYVSSNVQPGEEYSKLVLIYDITSHNR